MGIGFETAIGGLLAAQMLGVLALWAASRRRRAERGAASKRPRGDRAAEPGPALRLARAPSQQRFFPVGTAQREGLPTRGVAGPLPIRGAGGAWPGYYRPEPARPVLRPAWERPASWSELVDEEDAVTPVRLPGMTVSDEPETEPRARVPVYSLAEAKYLLAKHRRNKNPAN